MKRALIAAVAGLCLAASALVSPAMAQSAPVDGDATGVLGGYVALFNKGDAAALAKDVYDIPGTDPAVNEAKLKAEIETLRRDDFGKLDLYGFKTCPVDEAHARVEMRFGLLYTFGGLMPPGDQAKVFSLAKTANGWRIRGEEATTFETPMSCTN